MNEYLHKYGHGVADMLFDEFTHEDALKLAREEAREEGFEKGREEVRESVAKKMLSSDLSLDFVAKYTELDIARLEALKAEIAS